MEAVLVVGTLIQVVGAISAGNAQASALEQQAEMQIKQAGIYSQQIAVDAAENDRRVAIEKAATAQEALQRTEKLQRIMGATIAKGAGAGIGTQYGTITALNENSSYEASLEQSIARDNSNNRIVSLNLNSAVNQQNLANKARGSLFEASQSYASASEAKFQGYMSAIGSLMNYGSGKIERGSVPDTTKLSNGDTITWN